MVVCAEKLLRLLILVGLLLVLLSVPFLSLKYPTLSGNRSIEFRTLQDLPALPNSISDSIQWPKSFEQFVVDRFPFRELIIKNTSKILYQIGISISPTVMVGKDGWLFLRQDSNIYDESRGSVQLSKEQLTDWVKVYVERKNLVEAMGARLLMVIVPNKYSVYPQYIDHSNFQLDRTVTDQILQTLRKKGVEGIVDLRPVLQDRGKDESKLVYDKFNTHWNYWGAYIAYKEILQYLPKAVPLETGNVHFSQTTKVGDLSRLIGNDDLGEDTFSLQISNSRIIKVKNWNQYTKKPMIFETNLRDNSRVLFLCDSFTEVYLYKFLSESFEKSYFLHHSSMTFKKDVIEKINPDLIVYIIVERLLPYKLTNT